MVNKYSFHKKLGLRLATNYIVDAYKINHFISQKPTLRSSLVDFKQRWNGRVLSHSLVEIQLKRHKIRGHSFICILQCILLSCNMVCGSAVFRMTAHDICANSAHHPLWEQLMDIYANSAHGICVNSKWLLTTAMQIALTQKGQAALWATNGCTSMSKPIIT